MPLPWLFKAFDVNGAPLADLTPTWAEYRHAETGASVTPPDFEGLTSGSYRATRTSELHCGIADLGATAFPRYVHLACQRPQTFTAFDTGGALLPDLSPTWASFINALHLDDGPSAPAIDCLASGSAIYAIMDQDPPLLCVGTIDLGATALPRYIDVTTNSARSVIANFDPAVGSTLAVSDLITCDVTDDSGAFLKILLIVRFPDGTSEVVYGAPGQPGGFEPFYAARSTVAAITDGFHFEIGRQWGWPAAPTILPVLLDSEGQETP